MSTELDVLIEEAIAKIQADQIASHFDIEKYIEAFKESAQQKAQGVLEHMKKDELFSSAKPVFLSVGGGDGEELDFLLRHSSATRGVLIEISNDLCERARKRILPDGKTIEVIPKSAQTAIEEAVGIAYDAIKNEDGQVLVVSCHGVIHELFDRGDTEFDPVGFFGAVFADENITTFFTYREPGAPEKWPDVVLLSAACHPKSLLKIVKAIVQRHPALASLTPKAQIIGGRVRLHKQLAIEVLAKLFYLEDLGHELQERSSAVNHQLLQNALWTAIGYVARDQLRASIYTLSSPTQSFITKWESFGVRVDGLAANHTHSPLPIAESQTRVVAWRKPPLPIVEIPSTTSEGQLPADVSVAYEAMKSGDRNLLLHVLTSCGRMWIESSFKEAAIKCLNMVYNDLPSESLASLWAGYLLSISRLFEGDFQAGGFFNNVDPAEAVGLGLLFKAEQMEFSRKSGDYSMAVKIANEITPPLVEKKVEKMTDLDRYVYGTTLFLLTNLLRLGGRYERAWSLISEAEKFFIPGVKSHDTEIAHCFYARQVCVAMTGLSQFSMPYEATRFESQYFANALIHLSYSHAAWFVDDIERACEHARHAAEQFEKIDAKRYRSRAKTIHYLLLVWRSLKNNTEPDYSSIEESISLGIQAMISGSNPDYLKTWFPKLRPCAALGISQFAQEFSDQFEEDIEIAIPQTLVESERGSLAWSEKEIAGSLASARTLLCQHFSIPEKRRIPLIAD